VTTKALELKPHPRLYMGPDAIARLQQEPKLPLLKMAARQVKDDAERYAEVPPLTYRRDTHNELLVRAREVQGRVLTLLARWKQTGAERFRAAVLKHVEQMGRWEYWSWIAWRAGDSRPDAIFDLSYGENSLTLAVAYDWLHEGLSPQEKKRFLDVARRWAFRSGRKHARPGGAWWFGKPDTNWNTVCAGGLGTLCLSMYEDAAEARTLLPMCERSVAPFMKLLDRTGGAWPEGIGYWNYGMQYGFTYLLSHESATGRRHPLMRLGGVRRTLSFPLDFCPHGQACSFGDVNHWSPLPFHYATALRLGCGDVARQLDALLERRAAVSKGCPNAAEWLALHPGTPAGKRRSAAKGSVVKLYKGLDWGVLADSMPDPRVYLCVRGGTTKVPHGHRDLLSFHCVVGGERLITDVKPAEYLDTTFSSRRDEIFEMSPASKNTILINGVGITPGSSLDRTERVRLPGAEGIRLEATTAMGWTRSRGAAVRFCGRLVLLLGGRAFLIIDRVEMPFPGRMESRMHTSAQVQAAKAAALLRGETERLRIACACNVPAILCTGRACPTTPTAPAATVLRWCTEQRLFKDITMVTLLSPGAGPAKLALGEQGSRVIVTASGRGWRRTVKLTKRLRPARG